MMEEPQSWGEKNKHMLDWTLGNVCTQKHFYLSHSFLTKIFINSKWQTPALERDKKRWAERKREEKRRGGGDQHTVMTQELRFPHNNPTNTA